MVKILQVIFLILSFSSIAFNQVNPAGDFSKAVALYEQEKFDDALILFNQILNDPEAGNAHQSATIFKSKILLSKKKYFESEKLLKDFINSSPEGSYKDEARLTLAKNLYEQTFYYPAFNELVRLLNQTNSALYKTDAEKYAELIALTHLDPVQVKPIAETSETKIKPFLFLLLAKMYEKNGLISESYNVFHKLVEEFPFSNEAVLANKLLQENKSLKSGECSIGILLPLAKKITEGSTSTLAWEVLEGIKYATDEFNRTNDSKIGLVVRSTTETEQIKNITEEFSANESVKIVLGPIFSNEVISVLSALKRKDIPVISPTATDDELVALNKNFFQANPGFTQRGIIMANYIYNVEGKKRIAVINSIEGYSPIIASAFVEEFKRLGGKIILRETYKYGTTISSAGLEKLREYKNSLDGIFVPLSDKSDAPFILSGLVQNEIDLPLYGNQDWMQAKGFETSTTLSNKLVFTSDYFIEYSDPDYQTFSKEFSEKTKMELNRNVLYGYDTAKYLLTVISNTISDRKKICDKMESGIRISGYHNYISFDKKHVNRNLNIVKYNNGIFELIDRYELK
ncbi:MAG: penicillin-binding protein activator [Ignavibacteriales bacterium]|nr:MAG: penicillin-binding protein activator [Ignavibacteriales bacterium]